jgi:hypothetical protein
MLVLVVVDFDLDLTNHQWTAQTTHSMPHVGMPASA